MFVMPGRRSGLRPAQGQTLVPGLHAFLFIAKQGVDGRDKPGHDVERDCSNGKPYFPADFGSATIMSSSIRAPGDESWLMHTVVLAGSQSPK